MPGMTSQLVPAETVSHAAASGIDSKNNQPPVLPTSALTTAAPTPTIAQPSTSMVSHGGQNGVSDQSPDILPLAKLWQQLNNHTVYAAYFIPLEINVDAMVAAQLQDLPKVTLGHSPSGAGSPTAGEQACSTGIGQAITVTSTVTVFTSSGSPGVSPLVPAKEHPESTSAKQSDSTLKECQPKIITTTLATDLAEGRAPSMVTTTMTIPRTHRHRTGACEEVQATTRPNVPGTPITSLEATETTALLKTCAPATLVRTMNSMASHSVEGFAPTQYTTTLTFPRTHESGTGACMKFQLPTSPEAPVMPTTSVEAPEVTALTTGSLTKRASSSNSRSWNETVSSSLAEAAGESTMMPMASQEAATDITPMPTSVSETQAAEPATAMTMEDGGKMKSTDVFTDRPALATGTGTAEDAGGVPTDTFAAGLAPTSLETDMASMTLNVANSWTSEINTISTTPGLVPSSTHKLASASTHSIQNDSPAQQTSYTTVTGFIPTHGTNSGGELPTPSAVHNTSAAIQP